MKNIAALFGWRYVKDCSKNMYHYYNCSELKETNNREISNKTGMKEDLMRHPFTLGTCACLAQII